VAVGTTLTTWRCAIDWNTVRSVMAGSFEFDSKTIATDA
jgi:hypothetical protein